MPETVYFVVVRQHGREQPQLVYDHIPASYKPGIVYTTRLDALPDADKWLAMSLQQLYDTFVKLRAKGKLPPANADTSHAKSEPARRLLGDWYYVKDPPWPNTPLAPIGELRRRRSAPASINERHIAESGE